MKITEELLQRGKSSRGGWTKEQFAIIGISWPPFQGWKNKVIGNDITEDKAKRFVQLRKIKFNEHKNQPGQMSLF